MNDGTVQGEWHTGLWLDVGTVERLAFANTLVQQGKLAVGRCSGCLIISYQIQVFAEGKIHFCGERKAA